MSSKLTVFLATAMAAATLLAGCGGKSKSTEPDPGTDDAGPVEYSDTTGAIEGWVFTVEQVAVVDAQVALIGTEAPPARTDLDGRFVYSNLEPGPYTVQVQKIGFSNHVETVQVVAGEPATLEIMLVEQQAEGIGYSRPLQPIPGRFACAVGVDGIGSANCKILGGNDAIDQAWTDATGGDNNFIDFPTLIADNQVLESDQIASVVVEIKWTPVNAAANTLWLQIEQTADRAATGNASEPATYSNAVGGTGLKSIANAGRSGPYGLDIPNPSKMPATIEGFSIAVMAMGEEANPAVAPLQQEFEVWITLFYNVAADPDYSALG